MNRISIGKRLACLLMVLLGLIIMSAGSSVYRASQSRQAVDMLFHQRIEPLSQLYGMAQLLDRGVRNGADGARQASAFKDLQQAWQHYAQSSASVDDPEALKQAGQQLDAIERVLTQPDPLAARQALQSACESLAVQLDQLVQHKRAAAAKANDDEQATYQGMLWRNLLIVTLVVIGAAAASVAMTRSIVRPIRAAVHLAQTVAAGDLSSRIEVHGTDETAQLLHALSQMTESLVGIVGQVRASADSIATGSGEIAGGNADLSQRTEQQASNLQQTNASMEQLGDTLQANAHSAIEAARRAQQAAGLARQGGAMVEQSVQRMALISDTSRRIADIIGTIDGIAFQTNILALNAAVEAARAGEQGRGFAVVASEVRGLAQRSAVAAREIKGLIAESTEAVSGGVALIDEVGRTIGSVVAEVNALSGLVQAISTAGLAQTHGIGEVSQAIAQIDQSTQQNAALVEESAAAAESLRHQAARMVEVVRQFRLT